MRRNLISIGLFAALTSGVAGPLAAAEATATVHDRSGHPLGTVDARDTPSGITVLTLSMTGVPEGLHGVHLHETGDCSAADFTSAGGHIAGEASHGVMAEDGPHPGDLPNVVVQTDGAVQQVIFNGLIDVSEHLLDEDGAAFIIHSGPDDYRSQPSGDAGERIACGVFVGN